MAVAIQGDWVGLDFEDDGVAFDRDNRRPDVGRRPPRTPVIEDSCCCVQLQSALTTNGHRSNGIICA